MVDMVFTIFKLRNSKIDLSHIFGSFQDSVNIMITWTMRFTAYMHYGKLNCDGKIFRGTFHPFVIVLYFYRAHEYKFGEKLAVNGIESLNFWQWCSLAEVRGGKVGLAFNHFQKIQLLLIFTKNIFPNRVCVRLSQFPSSNPLSCVCGGKEKKLNKTRSFPPLRSGLWLDLFHTENRG